MQTSWGRTNGAIGVLDAGEDGGLPWKEKNGRDEILRTVAVGRRSGSEPLPLVYFLPTAFLVGNEVASMYLAPFLAPRPADAKTCVCTNPK